MYGNKDGVNLWNNESSRECVRHMRMTIMFRGGRLKRRVQNLTTTLKHSTYNRGLRPSSLYLDII
jgi:hypothetical protein